MTTAHTQGEWDLRVEFTKPGGMQRESRIDELLPRLVPAVGSVITEHGESVMAGDIDRMIIPDGDDEHPQGRRVVACINWQAFATAEVSRSCAATRVILTLLYVCRNLCHD